MSSDEFREILAERWPELSSERVSKVVKFREQLLDENERQNLTRITAPADFYEGHVEDVRALLASGLLDYPAIDVGSGGGVPGLLSALVGDGRWILAESEGRKADFLQRAVKALDATSVEVFAGRAEKLLEKTRAASLVARAVGPVDRIYAWVRGCSTWNNLILLKGPGWEAEWAKFQESKSRRELEIVRAFDYEVGPERKKRLIVKLRRVPRGTR